MFDEALEPCGLRSTQLVILLKVATTGAPTISRLASEMVMDSSTLGRNLRPLEREGLVRLESGRDRRRKTVALTEQGAARIRSAVPLWRAVQSSFVEQLGSDSWEALRLHLSSTVAGAQAAGTAADSNDPA